MIANLTNDAASHIEVYAIKHENNFKFYDFLLSAYNQQGIDDRMGFIDTILFCIRYGGNKIIFNNTDCNFDNLEILNAYSELLFKDFKRQLRTKGYATFDRNSILETINTYENVDNVKYLKNYINEPEKEIYKKQINEVIDYLDTCTKYRCKYI